MAVNSWIGSNFWLTESLVVPSLHSLPVLLNPLLYFLSAGNHWESSEHWSKWREVAKRGGVWRREHQLVTSGFMARETAAGRRSNWWVTHNQPPYRGPAKLDCIQRLVIRPDLANVSHSSPEPRQLFVIRAWPGLPLLPLDCQPSIRFLFHPVCILTVSGEEATEGLLTRSVCLPWSLVFFCPPQQLFPLYIPACYKYPKDK